jgi:C2 domain-containing protein
MKLRAIIKKCIFFGIILFLSSPLVISIQQKNNTITVNMVECPSRHELIQIEQIDDIDPLLDLIVTVEINSIRALESIDKKSDPDFYVKVMINGNEFQSPVWKNRKYLTNINWSCTFNVPDEEEFVEIQIQLWDWNLGKNILCDIANNDNNDADRNDLFLYYSLKSGHWDGDDYYYPYHAYFDASGYGRGNGCDDNSIYQNDKDCEIYFTIKQNDFDYDEIPYWTETEIYHTDPTINDKGRDDDNDSIPIEWEHKWGHHFDWYYNQDTGQWEIGHDWHYHPFQWNDHTNIDLDNDGLTNIDEYHTSQWGSDPFRDDIFIELDQMGPGPNGEQASLLPNASKDFIRDAFHRQNIGFHLDDGTWEGQTGSEIIPFDTTGDNSSWFEINNMYNDYFLHGDDNNWRKGVFHHGLVIYNAAGAPGFCYRQDAFQISCVGMEKKARLPFPLTGNRDVVYASAYMHELGHSLGLMWLGGHDEDAYYPWQPLWWKFRPYRSIMNYGYMFGSYWNLIDYSDGSRGKNDFDDWSNIDFYYFKAQI